MIWIATSESDYNAHFTQRFVTEANVARDELALSMPDVKLHFTGGIASYRKYLDTVTSDTDMANVWGLVSVFVLLVLGFRAFSPFAMLMLLLIVGTTGTLVFQNLVFGGVNMIATAGTLAVIGIGSDYGVIVLTQQRAIFDELVREAPPGRAQSTKARLELLRRSIKEALGKVGTPTVAGAMVSAAAFLCLAGAELKPMFEHLFGMEESLPESFQPIRELALGGSFGLVYCLALMLVVLPALLYATEWVLATPPFKRLRRVRLPGQRALRKNRRWLRLKGSVRESWRTDYERRWFRSLALWSVRRRFGIIGVSLVIGIVSLVVSTNIEWSRGQKDVEPRNSLPVRVAERVERVFGKSFENVLVVGPLAGVRQVHRALDAKIADRAANVGDVISIDDYLPAEGEPQDAKIEVVRKIDAALAGIRPELPPGLLIATSDEVAALSQALAERKTKLLALKAEGDTRAALVALGGDIDALVAALAGGEALEPAADWSHERVRFDGEALAAIDGKLDEIAGEPWLAAGAKPAATSELKALRRELGAASELGRGMLQRRDLEALALALQELIVDPGGDCRKPALAADDPCKLKDLAGVVDALRAAAMVAPAAGAAAAPVTSKTIARAAVEAPALAVTKFLADSGIYELSLGGTDFVAERDALERAMGVVTLRQRPRAPASNGMTALLEASYRLRRSLDTLRSFAATSNYASVGPAIPATAAAADRLIASLHRLAESAGERAEGVVATFDAALASELFERFTIVKKAAAHIRAPLEVKDVPESALKMFRGQGVAAGLFLARVLPRVSMLQREPYEATKASVEAAIATVPAPPAPAAGAAAGPHDRVGYSGFEVLLNLATDYLEGTFSASMIAVCGLALLVVLLLLRTIAGTFVTVAPVALGTLLTIAMMVMLDMPISIFTVIAIPIVIGVGIDSAILAFDGYWAELKEKGRRPVEDSIGPSGKAVTLNVMTTVIPFAALVGGDMQGLVALGFILAAGTFFCYLAQLLLMPALISVMQDFVVPGSQYALSLWPKGTWTRVFRFLLGRWQKALPFNDSGIVVEHHDEVVVATMRRPPLNLMDAASVAKGTEYTRLAGRDPDVRAIIWHSGLPSHYRVVDERGEPVVDERGRTRTVAAAKVDDVELGPGQRLVGPLRTMGAGADLGIMSTDLLNAYFMLKGTSEYVAAAWYSPKPIIFIAEGDAVAGSLEIALYSNYLLVTKDARIGAPEVKQGLTLPFGSHALQFRAGTKVAQQLMASGELISGEEAVRLGIADGLVPDGEDPVEYAKKLARSREFRDLVHQTAMLRQYGPPMRSLITRSVKNYVKLLRSPETRERLKRYQRNKAAEEPT